MIINTEQTVLALVITLCIILVLKICKKAIKWLIVGVLLIFGLVYFGVLGQDDINNIVEIIKGYFIKN